MKVERSFMLFVRYSNSSKAKERYLECLSNSATYVWITLYSKSFTDEITAYH